MSVWSRILSLRSDSPIGLDIQPEAVHAVQTRGRAGRAAVIRAAVSIPRADPSAPWSDGESVRVRDVLDRHGFAGRTVVIAAPSQSLMTQALDLPKKDSGAPLDRIVAAELARTHRRAPGTFEAAWWEIPPPPRGADGTHVIAAALPHESAEELIGVFDRAGMDVAVIDLRCAAVARAARPTLAPDAMEVLVDLGWSRSTVVLTRAGRVLYERAIDEWSLRALHEGVARVLNTDAATAAVILSTLHPGSDPHERRSAPDATATVRHAVAASAGALAAELQVSFTYIAHRFPGADGPGTVERVMLTGPGAAIPEFAPRVSERLEVRVGTLSADMSAHVPEELLSACARPELVAALGLALWTEDAA